MASLIKRGNACCVSWREHGKQRRKSLETTNRTYSARKHRTGVNDQENRAEDLDRWQAIGAAPVEFQRKPCGGNAGSRHHVGEISR